MKRGNYCVRNRSWQAKLGSFFDDSIVYLCLREVSQNLSWPALSGKTVNNQNKRCEGSKIALKVGRIFICNMNVIFSIMLYSIYHHSA